jgi:hypothetical protein
MPGSRVHSKQEGWKEVAPEKPGSSEARPVQGLVMLLVLGEKGAVGKTA